MLDDISDLIKTAQQSTEQVYDSKNITLKKLYDSIMATILT